MAKYIFLTGLLMETLLKQRLMLSKLAELHEDQDQLSDFLIAKSWYRLIFFPPISDVTYWVIFYWNTSCLKMSHVSPSTDNWIFLYRHCLGDRQSYWRSLEGTWLLPIQWHPSLPVCPSPGLETKRGTGTESRHPPAAVCRTLQLRLAVSKARIARIRYVTLSNFKWK